MNDFASARRYAEQAQLELIYAYYKNVEPEAAKASAERFIRLHPQHANVDYAYYLKGLASFDQDRGLVARFLPLDLTMSSSALYELIEWGAAVTVGSELGAAYLGTQGDVWDAHKDMTLAALGALIAMTVTALVNRHMNRDFANEWAESIRVKRRTPLGEGRAPI